MILCTANTSRYFSLSEAFTSFVLKNFQILSDFSTAMIEDSFSDMLREIYRSFCLSVSISSLTPNMKRQDTQPITLYFSFFRLAPIFFFFLTSVTKTNIVPPNATLVCSPIIKHQHSAPLVNQQGR